MTTTNDKEELQAVLDCVRKDKMDGQVFARFVRAFQDDTGCEPGSIVWDAIREIESYECTCNECVVDILQGMIARL